MESAAGRRFVLTWRAGMIAAVDGRRVTEGEAIGSVEVHERSPDGSPVPYPHLDTFWFAWSGYDPATTVLPADAAGD